MAQKKKQLRNVSYLSFDEETKSVIKDAVMYADETVVETKNYVLETTSLTTYVDIANGHTYYIDKLNYDNLKESRNLSMLRRSMAIKNIFSYDTTKPLDIMAFLPWIVIILLAIFK